MLVVQVSESSEEDATTSSEGIDHFLPENSRSMVKLDEQGTVYRDPSDDLDPGIWECRAFASSTGMTMRVVPVSIMALRSPPKSTLDPPTYRPSIGIVHSISLPDWVVTFV